MKQKYKIIHLPTNDVTKLCIGVKGNLCYENIIAPKGFQHLYILSDEEIKEGDWCYNNVYPRMFKCTEIDDTTTDETYYKGEHVLSPKFATKKIIATTDPKLLTEKLSVKGYEMGLNGQIPQSLIKAYAEQQMEYVMLDIEECVQQKGVNFTLMTRLKLSPKNEVVWSEVEEVEITDEEIEARIKIGLRDRMIAESKEEMYSRKEVKKLLIQYQFDRGISPIEGKEFDDWIKENLK